MSVKNLENIKPKTLDSIKELIELSGGNIVEVKEESIEIECDKCKSKDDHSLHQLYRFRFSKNKKIYSCQKCMLLDKKNKWCHDNNVSLVSPLYSIEYIKCNECSVEFTKLGDDYLQKPFNCICCKGTTLGNVCKSLFYRYLTRVRVETNSVIFSESYRIYIDNSSQPKRLCDREIVNCENIIRLPSKLLTGSEEAYNRTIDAINNIFYFPFGGRYFTIIANNVDIYENVFKFDKNTTTVNIDVPRKNSKK